MYKVIGVDNQVYGPVDAQQIRQWIQERRLSTQSQLQKEGEDQFRPLTSFPEFADLLAAAAPPVPTTPPLAGARPAAGYNNLAITGFVMGLLSLICCGPLFGLLGIIFSSVALSQINKNPAQAGRPLAIAGIVLSILGLILTIVLFALGSFREVFKNFPH